MTGAVPNSAWLNDVYPRCWGFIKTGSDLTKKIWSEPNGPMPRAPYLLETSLPGVFAVGDVRCGSVSASRQRWAKIDLRSLSCTIARRV